MFAEQRFLDSVFAYIEREHLLHAGDTVLVGVSGGADSLCLLEVLRAYAAQKKEGLLLRAVHVEHGIRGEASREDAAYVEQFCAARAILCTRVAVDARAFAEEKGYSLEEAARILRYDAFETAAADVPQAKIAVAHHSEDQAETVLWQLIRGSDIRGLGGMRARRGYLIRPLLAQSRADIEAFLRARGIMWREDATNAELFYTRNRLRLRVLPELTSLNAQAVQHLCESAARAREAEDYLEAQTQRVYDKLVCETAGKLVVDAALCQQEPLLQRRVLYRALYRCAGSVRDIEAKHVALLQELFSHQVGKRCILPYELCARRTYEGLELVRGAGRAAAPGGYAPELVHMEVCEVTNPAQLTEISKKKYTKCFDYDRIEHHVQIRTRQSGDYLTIDAAGHRQKLKSYLINEKIPASERGQLLLLADGAHIMWVIGHRISDYYKVDENTRRILKVQYSGGKENE